MIVARSAQELVLGWARRERVAAARLESLDKSEQRSAPVRPLCALANASVM